MLVICDDCSAVGDSGDLDCVETFADDHFMSQYPDSAPLRSFVCSACGSSALFDLDGE